MVIICSLICYVNTLPGHVTGFCHEQQGDIVSICESSSCIWRDFLPPVADIDRCHALLGPLLANNESKGHHLSSVVTSSSPLPWLLWVMGTCSQAFFHFISSATLVSLILILKPAAMMYIKNPSPFICWYSCNYQHVYISSASMLKFLLQVWCS